MFEKSIFCEYGVDQLSGCRTPHKDRSNREHSNEDENEDIEDRLHTNIDYVDRRSRRKRGNRYHVMLSSFVVSLIDQVLDMLDQSRFLIIQHFTP